MSFASLSALYWLIPLAGIILALYLLKMRRRDVRVPASFLWPALTYEVRANALFQRLRITVLLLLQLLALILVVVALARPQMRQSGLAGELTVLVLDASASMSATDVDRSRFDQAVAYCRQVIDQVGPGDRLSLIEAGPSPRVVFPLSSDPGRMRSALDGLRPTDAEADVGEAMRLAASLTSRQSNARIVLISDGVFAPIENFSPGDAKVEYCRIGSQGENLAITALGAAVSPSGLQVFCGVRNYGVDARSAVLNLYGDGKLFNSIRIETAGRKSAGGSYPVPAGTKIIEARLVTRDQLAADNYAVTLADPATRVRVLLVGRGDLFLERALSLEPRVVLDRAVALPPTEKAGSAGPSNYEIVVFEGVPEEPVKARGILTFGAAGQVSPVRVRGSLQQPNPRPTRSRHAVARNLDLSGTFIDVAESVEAKHDADVLIESDKGPLVLASTAGGRRHLYVAFEPLKSDFPLQVSFPIFIANAVEYLAPRENLIGAFTIAAGRPFSVPAAGAGSLTLTTPDSQKIEIEASGGSYVVRDHRTVGRYVIETAEGRQIAYATLASEIESQIAPVEHAILGGRRIEGVDAVMRLADYWRPIILLGLLVLAAEWWVFARRS